MGSLIAPFLLLALCLSPAPAAGDAGDGAFAAAVAQLGHKSRSQVRDAVKALGALGDRRALPVLEALADKRLVVDQDGGVFLKIDSEDMVRDAVTGEAVATEGLELETARINNAVRRALRPAIARLQLFAERPQDRLEAAMALVRRPQEGAEDGLREALEAETVPEVRDALALALAKLDLGSADRSRRLAAIENIRDSADLRFRHEIGAILARDADGNPVEPDAEVRAAAARALESIEARQALISQAGNLIYGLSLGSVLMLAALGLAITFGLMGVINMAHGEMLMLGAYTTFAVQGLFKTYLPGVFDTYLLAAIPAAFVVSGTVGVILERSVIRHLYGRPLETLLATWGISLVLIQTVRVLFGAQNVEVANPEWLSGGATLAQNLVLPYNRLATVVFAVLVITLVWYLFQRTRLGLQVRAVTQNRQMAAGVGINTRAVDMWTFGLGSGVAGLGGVALSQLGNVGPELGQQYIVDSFMVVVLGGVGKLAGAVAGAMTLGMVNKFLEPYAGAVLGKIMVLIFIILFIQKRPQGLFAMRGRSAEG